jgi:hypothetical protein
LFDEHVSFHPEFRAEGVPEDPVRLICLSVAPAEEDGGVIWNSGSAVAAVVVVGVVGVCLEETSTVSFGRRWLMPVSYDGAIS